MPHPFCCLASRWRRFTFQVPAPLILHKKLLSCLHRRLLFVPMLTEMPTVAPWLRWHRGRLRGDKWDGVQTSLHVDVPPCAKWKRRYKLLLKDQKRNVDGLKDFGGSIYFLVSSEEPRFLILPFLSTRRLRGSFQSYKSFCEDPESLRRRSHNFTIERKRLTQKPLEHYPTSLPALVFVKSSGFLCFLSFSFLFYCRPAFSRSGGHDVGQRSYDVGGKEDSAGWRKYHLPN